MGWHGCGDGDRSTGSRIFPAHAGGVGNPLYVGFAVKLHGCEVIRGKARHDGGMVEVRGERSLVAVGTRSSRGTALAWNLPCLGQESKTRLVPNWPGSGTPSARYTCLAPLA